MYPASLSAVLNDAPFPVEKTREIVRELLNEVFGMGNFCGLIPFVKTSGQTTKIISPVCDYLLWYAKNKDWRKRSYAFYNSFRDYNN